MCVSSERAAAAVAATHADDGMHKRLRSRRARDPAADEEPRRRSGSDAVAVLLRDYRMLAHDDGDGRPLRYMSLYGGMVTRML